MESHRAKQQELISQLKQQLQDLEQYAYETGEAGLPQTMVVERQKVIIGNFFKYFDLCLMIVVYRSNEKQTAA